MLKFVCVSNDGTDEHMVWYLFLFTGMMLIPLSCPVNFASLDMNELIYKLVI